MDFWVILASCAQSSWTEPSMHLAESCRLQEGAFALGVQFDRSEGWCIGFVGRIAFVYGITKPVAICLVVIKGFFQALEVRLVQVDVPTMATIVFTRRADALELVDELETDCFHGERRVWPDVVPSLPQCVGLMG